jgi:DMSO/TMAO reductase YedYZ molybdopterin-dependent catalytic subunit
MIIHYRRTAAAAIAVISLLAPLTHLQSQSAQPTVAQSATSLVLRGLDGRERTVSAADLARLARHDTTVSAHEVTGRYSGVALTGLLALVNAPLADSLRGRSLATYVLVEASDGYRVLFSIAELDARFTDRVVLLADRKDGQPLPPAEGPYRLIVPGEKRPARWARRVVRVSLGRAN